MLKRFWRPETGVFLAVWLLLMIGGQSRLFRDPGTFWHTKLGQEMLESRELVYADPFSFTADRLFPGQGWIPHQWLGECLMALVHAVDGLDSLLLATVTLLACLYTWLAGRLIRAGLHWALAVSLTVLTIAASSSHFHVRPHLSTIVFFGLTCAFLYDFEMGRIGIGRLFWLVPMYVLWTNLHGGMIGGLLTIGLAVCGWGFAKLIRFDTPLQRWSQLVPLGLLAGACGLTAFVNPYGARLPMVWREIMALPLPDMILEHRRLNPLGPDGMTVLLLGAVYLFVLSGVRPWHRLRATWFLPLVWLFLVCTRIRHAPLFSIAAALAVADVFPHTRWAAALVAGGSDLFVPPARENKPAGSRALLDVLGPAVLPAALVLAVLLACVLHRPLIYLPIGAKPVPVFGHGWARLDPNLWPTELTGALQHYPPGTRIFNEMNHGGFLIYHAPNLRIFIDDRCELYRRDFLVEYDRVEREDPAVVERWARAYSFDLALALKGSSFDAYFQKEGSGWTRLAASPAAHLYERKKQ